MPAINYCVFKTNIWCIPTTEIATWWQVVIAAVAVYFAIRAIKATNATSQAVLDRDKNILDAKRAAFLSPLTNEMYEVLVRTYQVKNLLKNNDSKEACEHIFSVISLLMTPCIERCIEVIEAFHSDEASQLTKCSLTVSRSHNFVRGNPIQRLEDPDSRQIVISSLEFVVSDLEKIFSQALIVISKAAGLGATQVAAANQAARSPLLVPRESVRRNAPKETATPPSQNPPADP